MHSISKTILFAFFLFIFPCHIHGSDKTLPPFVVVIDAGHGGKDPGAIGGKYKEKDINLSVALKLGSMLEKSDMNIKVYYTRKTDIFLDLSERTSISNRLHANLFISVHSNASRNYSARGIETYVMGMEKSSANLQVAMRENSVITQEDDYSLKYEGYDPNSSESFIIFSLQQHSFQNESLKIAKEVQDKYFKYASSQMTDKGVKQANFLVLWKTAAPSILTEIGFISNQSDRMFICSDNGQNIIAKSICEAVECYLDTSNNTSSSSSVTDDINYQEDYDNLQYKVQIAATNKPIEVTKANFGQWSDRVLCEYNGIIFKYFVLGANVYEETLTLRDSLRKMFPDCFIVATYDGVIIDLEKARSIELNKRK